MVLRYIGVTGFMCKAQVHTTYQGSALSVNHSSPPLLMVGVLANFETLMGEKRNKRFPSSGIIRTIFPEGERFLNLVHYSSATEDPEALYREIFKIRQYGGERCHGLQLNLQKLPERGVFKAYCKEYSSDTVILQANDGALAQSGYDPNKFAEMIASYVRDHPKTGVVLSLNRGKGDALLGIEEKCVYIDALMNAKVTSVAVAGGLCAKNAHLLSPLLQGFPHVSVDAGGELCDKDERMGLSTRRAIQWIDTMARLYGRR